MQVQKPPLCVVTHCRRDNIMCTGILLLLHDCANNVFGFSFLLSQYGFDTIPAWCTDEYNVYANGHGLIRPCMSKFTVPLKGRGVNIYYLAIAT